MSRVKAYSGKKPGRWPDVILLCHHYNDNSAKLDLLPDRCEEKFPYVVLCHMRSGDVWRFTPVVTADTSVDVWFAIKNVLHYARTAMIYAYDLPRLWRSIGFWEGVENGWVKLRIEGSADSETDRGASSNKKSGCLIAADPPAACVSWISGLGCRVEWIDLRNYGITLAANRMEKGEYFSAAIAAANEYLATLIDNDLGPPCWTAASQAFAAWRAGPFPWTIRPTQDEQAIRLERAAVYGGRCEVYRTGVHGWPTYHLDFTSLYPSVMQSELMPIELEEFTTGGVEERHAEPYCDRLHIADCTIRTDRPDYPLRIDGRVIYPVGLFRTVLPDEDYREAWIRGHVVTVHSLLTYRSARIFGPIISKLWGLRQAAKAAGNRQQDQVIKRLMNSLSGKFNQREIRWEDAPEQMAVAPYGSEWVWNEDFTEAQYHRIVNWNHQRLVEGPAGRYSSPAITAHIMSLGRWRLQRAMGRLIRDYLLYVDTDSLIVSWEGRELLESAGLIRPGELGYLREIDRWNRLEILGQKHYNGDGRVVCAGLSAKSRWIGGAKFAVPVRVSLESALESGDPNGVKDREGVYTLPAGNFGRVGMPDGSTRPIEVKGVAYDGCE